MDAERTNTAPAHPDVSTTPAAPAAVSAEGATFDVRRFVRASALLFFTKWKWGPLQTIAGTPRKTNRPTMALHPWHTLSALVALLALPRTCALPEYMRASCSSAAASHSASTLPVRRRSLADGRRLQATPAPPPSPSGPMEKLRSDYEPYPYEILSVHLEFDVQQTETFVTSTLALQIKEV